MATNWSLPTITSTYTNYTSELNSRLNDAATMFYDITGSSNIPANSIRWDAAANNFTKYDGVSSWTTLSTSYAFSISGGSINNTPIGATTRNTGAFTTLSANGAVSFTAGLSVSGGSGLSITGNISSTTEVDTPIIKVGYNGTAYSVGTATVYGGSATEYIRLTNSGTLSTINSANDRNLDLSISGTAVVSLATSYISLKQNTTITGFGKASSYLELGTSGATPGYIDIYTGEATATKRWRIGTIASDTSGKLVIKDIVNADRLYLNTSGHFYPATTNTSNLGGASNYWLNGYINTLYHNGLSMTAGTNVDQLYTVTDTYALSTTWIDTTVNFAELATGTYIVQVTTGSKVFSGTMAWYASAIASDGTYTDEIALHMSADFNTDSTRVFLRVRATAANEMTLQVSASASIASASYVYKFRRII